MYKYILKTKGKKQTTPGVEMLGRRQRRWRHRKRCQPLVWSSSGQLFFKIKSIIFMKANIEHKCAKSVRSNFDYKYVVEH